MYSMSLANFDIYSNLPYLSPYINFVYQNLMHIHLMLQLIQMDRYQAETWSQHSQTSINHIQGVLQILIFTHICPISHHTLNLYSRI